MGKRGLVLAVVLILGIAMFASFLNDSTVKGKFVDDVKMGGVSNLLNHIKNVRLRQIVVPML